MNLTSSTDKLSTPAPVKKYLTVEVSGGFSAPVLMLLPPNMDPKRKYPLMVYVYAGPGDQKVTETQTTKALKADDLVTNYGVVYAMIDGRGTAYQSDEYLFANYRNLGLHEIEDQIFVTKKLLEQHE